MGLKTRFNKLKVHNREQLYIIFWKHPLDCVEKNRTRALAVPKRNTFGGSL